MKRKPAATLADRLRARWLAYRQSPLHLSLNEVDLATARAIALTARLRRVGKLDIHALPDEAVCEMLFTGTDLPRLANLAVSDYRYRVVVGGRQLYCPPRERMNPPRDGASLARCLAAARFPSLRKLELSDLAIGDDGVRRLAEAPTLAGLETLRLSDVGIGDEAARLLARGAWAESLRDLSVTDGPSGDAGAKHLAAAPWAPSLRRLALHADELGAAGVEALVERCRKLTDLSFSGGQVDDDAAAAIAAVKHPHLERLNLCRSAIGLRGAVAFAAAPANFPALKTIDFEGCPLGEEGQAALNESFWLKDAGRQSYRTRAGEQAAAYDRHIMGIAFPTK